jgi:pilus assembly protein CpaE
VAWHLAEGTQRRVALVDLDLLNGDVALQLDAQPSHALKEALDHPSRIDSLFVDRAVVHVTQRLDVLASLEPIGEAVLPSDDAATRLIAALQQRYRYVIVDIPATIVPSLPKLMHAPGPLVLVSDGTLASARDVGRWRALLSDETRDRTLLHVMNMQGMSGDLPESEWAAAFGHTPDVVIPYDRRVPIAVNEGRPAILTSRSLKGGLLALFRQIAGESEASPPSILERLFGQ